MIEPRLGTKCNTCLYWSDMHNDGENSNYSCGNKQSSQYNKPHGEFSLRTIKECSCYERGKTWRKVCMVTGASRGIGRAIALNLALNHHHDLALVSRNYKSVESVADEFICAGSGLHLPYECDVSNPEQASETFKKIYEGFGSIDVLVNNAGINSRQTLGKLDNLETALEGFDDEIKTNLRGTYICSYLASGYMLKNKSGGAIINISSIKGKEPTSSPGYGASKAGVIKLTRDFAKALAPEIRVNCIAPGFIDTGMTTELPENKKQEYRKMIPLERFGTVEEVAKVVAFLASPDASYITGSTIDVNGGYLMS